MDVQGRLNRGENIAFFLAALAGMFLAFPPSAHALEVGCFCTFVFVSAMFVLSIGVTLFSKNLIAKKFWKLTWGRLGMITFLEVVLLVAVLFLLQVQFYIRLLVYLPFAVLLNYALATSAGQAAPERNTPKMRFTVAALSALVLPVMVQIIGVLAAYLSSLITFKEVRV